MVLEPALYVLVCSLAWYGKGPNELAYRQEYVRVPTEQACYDLGKQRKATRAWIYYAR